MKNLFLPFLLLLIALLPITSPAQMIGSFSGGDNLSVGPGTAGFEFTVGPSDLSVQSLGVFDASGEGLSSAHSVGIWNAAKELIASVLVPEAGATEQNSFFYMPIPTLTLSAGSVYRIGASYSDGDLDLARGNASSVTANGASIGSAYLSTGSGFEYPDFSVGSANSGFFGPNAGFNAVPEPSSALFVGGLLVLFIVVYRRQRSIVL